ncbi:MAG TPA: histidine phosphatase family protein, partial [Amycolatopsis sp.]|nr:histidine phosphatase family protein [Amycolatopsis sp.]
MDRWLIVLRHAKSDWSDDLPDRERPLAPRGIRDAPKLGHWLTD